VNEADDADELYEEDTGDELEFESGAEEGDRDSDKSDEEYVYGDDELYDKPAKQRKIEYDDQKKKTLQKSKMKK